VPVAGGFGKAPGAEYNGHEVYETISGVNGGNPVGINTTLQNGSYDDPVGFYSFREKVPAGSPAEQNWLAPGSRMMTINVPQKSSPQIAVSICGFDLAPSVGSSSSVAIPGNRVVSLAAGTGNQGKLTIQWNAP
jgi:hypothetical protein